MDEKKVYMLEDHIVVIQESSRLVVKINDKSFELYEES